MRLSIYSTFFFCIVALASCSLSPDDKDTIVSIDPEFAFRPIEKLGAPNELLFLIETTENRPCKNAVIDNNTLINGRSISLFIEEVQEPADCVPGDEPATGIATLKPLYGQVYDLTITLKGAIENQGQIAVRPDRYEITLETDDGLVFQEKTLFKIPANTAWGYVAHNDENAYGQDAQALLSNFEMLGKDHTLANAHFGHFQTENGSIDWMPDLPEMQNVSLFLLNAEDGLGEMIQALSDFKTTHNETEVEAKLFLWDGREY